MDFHEKIKRSNLEVERCAQALKQEIQGAQHRHEGMEGELRDKERQLKDTRTALQAVREMAFERTLNGSSGELELPPATHPQGFYIKSDSHLSADAIPQTSSLQPTNNLPSIKAAPQPQDG
ncbi:hypothetical protein TrVFT333_010677 [Trichoderma virens FT-333]|nr:hypothetical protein TrVFT333_010677 [Trichoderma virens FT-333]